MQRISLRRNSSPPNRHEQQGRLRRSHRWLGLAAVLAVGVGSTIATAAPAAAAPGDSSNASARFLGGSLLAGGLNLDTLALLQGVASTNAGVPTADTDTANLDLTALSALQVTIPGGLPVGLLGTLIQLGAVNQFSQASDSGVSRAASGAVSDNGIVSLDGSGAFPAGAAINLSPLLAAAGLNAVINDLRVSLDAITGVAALNGSGTAPAIACGNLSAPTHCRDYNIAGGELTISSPTVATLTNVLTGPGGVAQTVDTAVGTLVGPNGLLAGVLAALNGALAPLLGNPGLAITITTDVAGALNTILDTPVGDGVVSINLRTGVITVDIDALLTSMPGNLGLDELAPNTEILSGPVLAALVSRVGTLLNTVPALVSTALTTTLNAAVLHIAADICLVGTGPTCDTPIVDIGTGISVHVDGTLAQIVSGIGATATITVKVAGIPIVLPVATLLTALAGPITNVLLGPTGVISTVTGTVATAVAGIVTTLSPALAALNTIASLMANVQEPGAATGSHREVALRATLISLLAGSQGVATIDLGRAEVGPNAVLPTATSINPTHGPIAGGQTVTITGTGFVPGATSVTIGGNTVAAVDVTVAPDGLTLTFVTPAHAAGAVAVTVTTPGGVSTPPLTYTYVPVPTAASLTPTHGPVAGGQAVTITGTGFVTGQTSVTIGGNTVPAGSVTVNSPTSLTFSTPAHAAGLVGVTVTTPGGTSTPALDYTYVPVPTAASLTPTQGPIAGGQTVTITGTGFVTGQTSVTIGGNIVPAGSVTVVSATSLTFSTPAHAAGLVGVTVTTPGGTSGSLGYTYLDAPGAASLSPTHGPVAGGQTVTITGSDFVAGATSVTIGGIVVPAGSVTVVSPTSLTFSTPAHTAGLVGVTVTTPGGTSTPALDYTYVPVPTAASLTPTHGPVAGGQTVTITGTGFVTGQTSVTIGGNIVPATSVTVASDGLTLTFVTPAHVAGLVGVTVTTPGGTSGSLGYTYVPVPGAASLTPTHGPVAGGQTVTVTGSDFVIGQTSVTIGGITVPAASVTVVSPTSLTFSTPAHAAGPVNVTVTTPGGTSTPALTYTYVPVPGAASLNPTHGPITGGQTVTVTGTDFVIGQTSVTIGGIVVPATDVTVASDGLTLTFETPAHAAGPVNVTATTPGGTSTPALVYTYVPVPTATSLTPTHGPITGGTVVTITGTDFVIGQTSVTIGGIVVPATDVTVASDGLTLTFVTPAHAAGPVNVTVTTPGGTSTPALDYTYVPVPTATSLTPTHGPVAGGQTVTVTGTGFVVGQTTVTIDGTTVAATVTNATTLTFVTPAHAAGLVGVTVTTPGGTSTPALDYTYIAAPTATGLTPTNGPITGGTVVTITGTGFITGATTVTIGGNTVPAGSVTVNSATSLTFSTPAHAAGAVDVTVTTIGGPSTPPLTYTYVPVPTAANLDPTHGPVAGGQTVTVNGTGFVAGQTTVTIGGTTVSATVTNATTLTFVTPAHAAGLVGVTVTTPGGTSSPALDYTYVPVPGATGIVPDHGPEAGGTVVVITGSDFVPGLTSVTIGGIFVPPTSIEVTALAIEAAAAGVTVTSPTSLTFTTPPHAPGPVGVTVTTPGGTSPAVTYTYDPTPPAPSTATIDPNHGPEDGGTTVVITGSTFVPGQTSITIGGASVAAADVTVDPSGTQLTFVTPAHIAGLVEVTATTQWGTSNPPLAYTYDATPTPDDELQPPVITAPTNGSSVDTTTPPISGTGQPGATVTVTDGGTILCTAVVNSGGNWACLSPALSTGLHTIIATQTLDGDTSDPSAPVTFTVNGGELPKTGGDIGGPLSIASLLLLVGFGFVITSRRRIARRRI